MVQPCTHMLSHFSGAHMNHVLLYQRCCQRYCIVSTEDNPLCTPTARDSYERLSLAGQALPPGFPSPFLFPDGLSSIETLLTNIQVLSQSLLANMARFLPCTSVWCSRVWTMGRSLDSMNSLFKHDSVVVRDRHTGANTNTRQSHSCGPLTTVLSQ